MHVPKTAGTSLRIALEAVYPESQRLYLYDSADLAGAVDPHRFATLPTDQRDQFRLVMGHFRFGLHEAIPGPSRYVTMLRDPVDRVVSLYYHYKSIAAPRPGSRGTREQELIREADLSLEDWVFGGKRVEADNAVVRQLAPRAGLGFGACPDDLLTEALEHIGEHFDAVLIRGRMSQSVAILGKLVGATLPPIGRANANAQRPPLTDVDPALRRRIRELNHLDSELFQLMVERFSETYERVVG